MSPVWIALLVVAGCAKGPPPEPGCIAPDPVANFRWGVDLLERPDLRTGEVDYPSAYAGFAFAASRGLGPKASFNAGWVAERLGDLTAAERHYREAYTAAPDYVPARESLARVLVESGRADEALTLYRAAPTAGAEHEVLRALVAAGRADDALSAARALLLVRPDDADVHLSLAKVFAAQGAAGRARLAAERALALAPVDAAVRNDVALIELALGDRGRAVTLLESALEIEPMSYAANLNLGYVAIEAGDLRRAQLSFERAVAAESRSVDARLGWATASRGLGDDPGAAEQYRQVVKIDPEFAATHGVAEILAAVEAVADRRVAERDALARRGREALTDLAAAASAVRQRFDARAGCFSAEEAAELRSVLDETQRSIDEAEVESVEDVRALLDALAASVDDRIAGCGQP